VFGSSIVACLSGKTRAGFRRGTGVAVTVAALALALSACGADTETGAAEPSTTTTTTSSRPATTSTTSAPASTTTAAPAALPSFTQTTTATVTSEAMVPAAAPAESVAEPALMPAVVCMNLQDAQDLIQAQGVFFSRSTDATGRGRKQVLDANWIVVAQSPGVGVPITEGVVDLSVVKIGEPNPC